MARSTTARQAHRRRPFSVTAVLAVMATIALICAIAGPAQASSSNTNATRSSTLSAANRANLQINRSGVDAAVTRFIIINELTQKCIGISDIGEAGDWSCTLEADQAWHWGSYYPGSTRYAQLINDEGWCLAVAGGSTTVGAQIVGYSCRGSSSPDQYWSWNGNGGYIVNRKATDKIIGIKDASPNEGWPLVLWEPEDHQDQHWHSLRL